MACLVETYLKRQGIDALNAVPWKAVL